MSINIIYNDLQCISVSVGGSVFNSLINYRTTTITELFFYVPTEILLIQKAFVLSANI